MFDRAFDGFRVTDSQTEFQIKSAILLFFALLLLLLLLLNEYY